MTHASRQQVEYSASVSAEQAADYFESLAAGIRQHTMLVESGNDSIELGFGDNMKLEAEFHANEKKSSIEFALSWRPDAGPAVRPTFQVITGDDMTDRTQYGDDLPAPFGTRADTFPADSIAKLPVEDEDVMPDPDAKPPLTLDEDVEKRRARKAVNHARTVSDVKRKRTTRKKKS